MEKFLEKVIAPVITLFLKRFKIYREVEMLQIISEYLISDLYFIVFCCLLYIVSLCDIFSTEPFNKAAKYKVQSTIKGYPSE